MRDIYSVGDNSETGEEILHVFGDTGHIAVLATERGIRWEVRSRPDFDGVVFKKYHQIRNSLPSTLEEWYLHDINDQLAASLFNALTANTEAEAIELFSEVEDRALTIRTPNQTRLHYYGYTLCVATLIGIILFSLSQFFTGTTQLVLLCAIGGLVGSVLSTLQRSNVIDIPDDEKKRYIFFQAIVTIAIGSISGGVVYILSYSDIALSFAKDNLYNLFTISLVAGFAERLIPDIFSQVGREQFSS
ncbi:hypothetical protein M3906_003452 [Vibrio metschnikovii]|nr:hypothetical protein [Vibrio metschnikovii]